MSATSTLASGGASPESDHPQPRRVAAIVDAYDISGPGRQLVGLATALPDHGVEMLVIMFQRQGRRRPPFADYLASAGVRFTIIPERGPFDLRPLSRLRAVLRELAPDVIETHSYKTTALVYLLRRFGTVRIPWVAFFHGATTENLKVRFYHWLDGRLLSTADQVVVMSEKHRRDFSHLGERVRVLYNSVVPLPPERGAPLALPAAVQAAVAGGQPLVGVVGRISPEKGVDVYLNAVAQLDRRGVEFVSVIAGDGPERASTEALAVSLGLAHRVHFAGPVRTIQSLYAQMDLLVIPSRSEGLPNVLLEAMHADVPVVSTRVGAVPEVLEGTEAGVLVHANDVAALADAIEGALHLKRDARSRASRAEVADRFSLDRRTEEHLRMYGDVLRRATDGPGTT